MKKIHAFMLLVGAMLFVMVALLPFFALAQEAPAPAPVSAAPVVSPDYLTVIAVAALAISEALALIPQLKANGLLHMVILALRKMLGRPVVPVVLLVLLAAGLSGCAVLKSKAPLLCSLATSQDVAQASTAVLSEIPEGTDKARAEQIFALAKLSSELGCEAVRAIEAQKLAAAQP